MTKPRTGKLKPVTVQWSPTKAGEYYSKASADLLEWEERGGPERTGLEIRVFKSRDSGDWIALADRPYTAEEFARIPVRSASGSVASRRWWTCRYWYCHRRRCAAMRSAVGISV